MADAKIILSAVDKTKEAVAAAQRNLRGLSDTADAVTTRLGTIGIAITGAFTAATLKGAIDTLDKLDDLAEKSGISVEALAGLRYAGEVTGTSFESLAGGTQKLAKNMAAAAGGNKEAAATFAALGISVKNADGSLKSQDVVLGEIADKFVSFQDGAEKAALAQRVFGKSGAEMIPLLNQGSAGIRQLTSEAEALGAVYGGALAKDAATFNDNLKKLELNAEAAKVAIAGNLLPTLNDLLKTAIQLSQVKGGIWGWLFSLESAPDLQPARVDAIIGETERKLASLRQQRADIEGSAAHKNAITREVPFVGTAYDLKDLEATEKVLAGRLQFYTQLRDVRRRELDSAGADLENKFNLGQGPNMRKAAPVVTEGDGEGEKAAQKEAKERARLLAELSGVQADYMEQLTRLQALRREGVLTENQYVDAVGRLIEKQPMAKKLIEDQAKAEKDLGQTREKVGALADKHLASLASESDAIMRRNAGLADEIEELGLTAEALDVLREMRLQANIERERENLLAAQNVEGNEAEVSQIERRIALLERQLGLQRELGGKRIDIEQRDKVQKESDEFGRTLHDDVKGALQRAFEDSRNPAEAFAKALASTLYTRVTNALADSIADGLLANTGLGGGGGAARGLLGSLGGTFASGLQASFSQTSIGSSGFGSGLGYGNMDLGVFLHAGGIAGSEVSFSRPIDPTVFRRAPRYHTGGLAGDEVPAILRRGEGVFTKGQMDALGGVIEQGSANKPSKISIVNMGPPLRVVGDRVLSDGERTLIVDTAVQQARAAHVAALHDGNSAENKAIRRNFNVRRAL